MRANDDFAAIIAGEVEAESFTLVDGTTGDELAVLGTDTAAGYGITSTLAMRHNDTTMTDSALEWTHKNPAETVKGATSVEFARLRAPQELPIDPVGRGPVVQVETRTTPGNRSGRIKLDAGQITTGGGVAEINMFSRTAGNSDISANADVITLNARELDLNPGTAGLMINARTARVLVDQIFVNASAGLIPIPGGGGSTLIPGMSVTRNLLAGDSCWIDALFQVNHWGAPGTAHEGTCLVNGVALFGPGDGYWVTNDTGGQMRFPGRWQYTVPVNGNYTFTWRMRIAAGGPNTDLNNCMACVMIYSNQ